MSANLLLLGMSLTGTPMVPGLAAPPLHVAECPVQTVRGRRLVDLYASADRYAAHRARNHVPRVAPERVRRLDDGVACARLREILAQRAASVGGSLDGAHPEYYTAGDHYYAVLPVEPRPCNAPRGSICIGPHWQALHVFDRNFNLIAAAAM